MTDPNLIQHAAPAIHHVKHVAAAVPQILHGVSYMTVVVSSVVSFIVGAGAGYYYKSRGVTGMQADLNTVKADVENLKAKIHPAT